MIDNIAKRAKMRGLHDEEHEGKGPTPTCSERLEHVKIESDASGAGTPSFRLHPHAIPTVYVAQLLCFARRQFSF